MKIEDALQNYEPVPESGCWIWLSGTSGNGYGMAWIDRKHRLLHRIFYEKFVGPIPKGLQLDHLCRIRSCVNPAHLEPVTRKENILRGNGFSALNYRKTHCVNGHEFNEENTVLKKRRGGIGRRCKICHRTHNSKSWHKLQGRT